MNKITTYILFLSFIASLSTKGIKGMNEDSSNPGEESSRLTTSEILNVIMDRQDRESLHTRAHMFELEEKINTWEEFAGTFLREMAIFRATLKESPYSHESIRLSFNVINSKIRDFEETLVNLESKLEENKPEKFIEQSEKPPTENTKILKLKNELTKFNKRLTKLKFDLIKLQKSISQNPENPIDEKTIQQMLSKFKKHNYDLVLTYIDLFLNEHSIDLTRLTKTIEPFPARINQLERKLNGLTLRRRPINISRSSIIFAVFLAYVSLEYLKYLFVHYVDSRRNVCF